VGKWQRNDAPDSLRRRPSQPVAVVVIKHITSLVGIVLDKRTATGCVRLWWLDCRDFLFISWGAGSVVRWALWGTGWLCCAGHTLCWHRAIVVIVVRGAGGATQQRCEGVLEACTANQQIWSKLHEDSLVITTATFVAVVDPGMWNVIEDPQSYVICIRQVSLFVDFWYFATY